MVPHIINKMFLQRHILYSDTISSRCNRRPSQSDVLRMGTSSSRCTALLMAFLETAKGEHPTSSQYASLTYKGTNKLRLMSWQAWIPAAAVLETTQTQRNWTWRQWAHQPWLILTFICGTAQAGPNFLMIRWMGEWCSGKKARPCVLMWHVSAIFKWKLSNETPWTFRGLELQLLLISSVIRMTFKFPAGI